MQHILVLQHNNHYSLGWRKKDWSRNRVVVFFFKVSDKEKEQSFPGKLNNFAALSPGGCFVYCNICNISSRVVIWWLLFSPFAAEDDCNKNKMSLLLEWVHLMKVSTYLDFSYPYWYWFQVSVGHKFLTWRLEWNCSYKVFSSTGSCEVLTDPVSNPSSNTGLLDASDPVPSV